MEVNASAWIKSNPTIKAVKIFQTKLKLLEYWHNKYCSCWNKGGLKITAVETIQT
jgi:hypothetical protein